MPRPPRLSIAHLPMHIIQRGNNRLPCFVDDLDYRYYLRVVGELLGKFDIALHAYVLMTNHVHLLATPGATGVASRFMQALGRRYVGYFNWRHERSGTLWEGRFKSCVVDSDSYLLRCYRYVELNPVRAAIVVEPGDYPWSSYRCNALGFADAIVQPHPRFLALDVDPMQRRSAYRALVAEAQDVGELAEIRQYISQERVLGRPAFQKAVAAMTGRETIVRPPGRRLGERPARSRRTSRHEKGSDTVATMVSDPVVVKGI